MIFKLSFKRVRAAALFLFPASLGPTALSFNPSSRSSTSWDRSLKICCWVKSFTLLMMVKLMMMRSIASVQWAWKRLKDMSVIYYQCELSPALYMAGPDCSRDILHRIGFASESKSCKGRGLLPSICVSSIDSILSPKYCSPPAINSNLCDHNDSSKHSFSAITLKNTIRDGGSTAP